MSPLRYELLPTASGEAEAAKADRPLTLAITCSPRSGPDHTVAMAERVSAMGHIAVPHIAARMVEGPSHLDAVLTRLSNAQVNEIFVVGGDAAEPVGPFRDGTGLLRAIRAHVRAPERLGAPCYPEGHPMIEGAELLEITRQKADLADYLVTQMCFDADRLRSWLRSARAQQINAPVFIGLPGAVDRKRLLEISLQLGVGQSISYVRKSRGVLGLLGRGGAGPAAEMIDILADEVGGSLGVRGFHFFTFNRLTETLQLVRRAPRSAPLLDANPGAAG